jgi:signal transduction histidine kinase
MVERNEPQLNMDGQFAQKALEALNQAALAIASELDVDKVLQLIVDSARSLVNAEYAALSVGDWQMPGPGNLHRFVTSGIDPERAKKIAHWPHGRGVLGAVVREGKPIRLHQVADDPRSVGVPPAHPPMGSFLGVPIVGAGETIGNLYLANKRGDEDFDEADQKLIEMLAAHAAVAIQNARLYAQVERLAVLEERTRIGMDLHDGVIQSIYAVGLTLESTRLALPDGSEEVTKLLDTAVEGLNDAIRDIRNFILDLRPRRFAGEVHVGLAQLVREFQANTMIPVTLSIPEHLDDLPLSHGRAIFLTTQEGLANIARHARATEVTIALSRTPHQVSLSIRDNGRGFDLTNEKLRVGHGLANMQARAESLRGAFKLESVPGQGAVINLELPL